MVRGERVKEYRFTSVKPQDSDQFSHSLNGETIKFVYIPDSSNTFATNGSLFINVSGTDEFLWKHTGGLNTTQTEYEVVLPLDETGTIGSEIAVNRVVNDPVKFFASGVGTGSVGTVIVYYR